MSLAGVVGGVGYRETIYARVCIPADHWEMIGTSLDDVAGRP